MMFKQMLKRLTLGVGLLAGTMAGAATPIFWLTNGIMPEQDRCQLLSQDKVTGEPDGFAFDGQGSYMLFRTPEKLSAVTFALQVNCIGGAAGDQAMLARRGFHNFLGCDRDGRPVLEIWNAGKNERIRLVGTTVLQPGKWYNLAGVVCPDGAQTRLTLYVDGKPEAEKSFAGQPCAYDNELLVGGCNPWGREAANMFRGRLNSLRVYATALSAAEVAGLVLPPPRAVKIGDSVSAGDFGAVPNDGKDDTAAVHRALAFMQLHKIHKLVFAPGTYDFHESPAKDLYDQTHWAFHLRDVNGLDIDGGGAKFLFHGRQFLIYSWNGSNITLRNLTVDYDRAFYSQGKVTALAADKRSFEIDIEPEYPVKGGEKVEAFLEMDPVSGLPAGPGLDVYYRVSGTELIGPQRLRVKMTDTIEVTPGKTILLRHDLYTASLLRFLHGENIRLENLEIRMGSGMAIVGQYIRNFTLEKVRITPAPERHNPMTVASDGVNLLGCSGRVLIDNCVLDGMGDDCFNIFTNYWSIKEVPDRHTIVIYNEKSNSQETPQEHAGDRFEFLNYDDLQVAFTRTIAKLEPDFKAHTARVTFTEELPENCRPGSMILMKQNQLESVILRNTLFRALRGRGVAIQAPNVTVENNRFVDNCSSGIHISTTLSPWFEAGPADKVMIRGNEFRNCVRNGHGKNSAVIQIGAVLRNREFNDLMTEGKNSLHGVHRDIRIIDNRIIGSSNGGMVINSVRNVEIRGNLLQDLSLAPVSTWKTNYWWSRNAVTMIGAHGVVFADNRYVDTRDSKTEGILYVGEGCDPDTPVMSGNSGFKVVRP